MHVLAFDSAYYVALHQHVTRNALPNSFMANVLLGMIWYSDGMFGKLYEELEFGGKKKVKSMSFSMRGMFATSFFKSWVLHCIYMVLGFSNLGGTIVVALLLAAHDTCGLMDDYLFTNNPFTLNLIHIGFSFLSITTVLVINWGLFGV